MAIKLTSGNLYFIRDIDYLTGEIGNYVKIGIVTKDRTTEERIKDHQTGNPRGIHPIAEVKDVPFVERLETHLHYENNEQWIAGEWFLLNDIEVDSVVARAELLKAQQLTQKPIIEHVLLTLDKTPSNGTIKAADAACLNLEQQLIQLKGEINVLKAKIELSKFVFYTQLGANGSIEGVLRIKYAPGKYDFDKKAFEVAHPALYKKYTLPRPNAFKHNFNYTHSSSYSLNTIDPGLHASLKALDDTTYSASQLSGTMKRTKNLEQLHLEHLKLMKELKLKEYEQEMMEYSLKYLVGEHDGIEGICSWKRFFAPQTPEFNETEFKKAEPALYASFLTLPPKEIFSLEIEKCRPYKPQ